MHFSCEDTTMVVKDGKITPGQVVYWMVFMLTVPALVLFLSGDWAWPEGWLFGAWYVIMGTSIMIYLYYENPALLAERFRRPGTGGEKKWDKYFLLAMGLAFLAWLVIMPLDAKRYGWTAGFPAWLKALGGIGLLVSLFFLYRAFTDNPFLSPLIRIQRERGHRVITTGVYSFVRHPMYLGAILMFVGAPMLPGSLCGIVVGALTSLLLAFRAIGEEKMLVKELEGYADYTGKVKYRLIPHVW